MTGRKIFLALVGVLLLVASVLMVETKKNLETCEAELHDTKGQYEECEQKTCIDVYKYTILAADNQVIMSAAQTLSDEIDDLNAKLRHCGCLREGT